jgi:hypothetical protein
VIITMSSGGADGWRSAFFGFAARFGAAVFAAGAGLAVLPARRADFVGDAAVVSGAGVDGLDAGLRRVGFLVSDIYDCKTSLNKTLSLSRDAGKGRDADLRGSSSWFTGRGFTGIFFLVTGRGFPRILVWSRDADLRGSSFGHRTRICADPLFGDGTRIYAEP